MDENTALGLDTSNPSTLSEESGPTHTVTVDGEQMDVSQTELINGYQRQADYTRKTQELATERERLAQGEAIVQALESDPESAVSALADAFGIRMGNQVSVSEEVSCPLLTLIPDPAIAVKKSATVSFLLLLLSFASINAILSFCVSNTPADNVFKLNAVK